MAYNSWQFRLAPGDVCKRYGKTMDPEGSSAIETPPLPARLSWHSRGESANDWCMISCWTDFQGEYWRLLLPARRPFLVQVVCDETNLYKLKHVMTTIFNETCHDHVLLLWTQIFITGCPWWLSWVWFEVPTLFAQIVLPFSSLVTVFPHWQQAVTVFPLLTTSNCCNITGTPLGT